MPPVVVQKATVQNITHYKHAALDRQHRFIMVVLSMNSETPATLHDNNNFTTSYNTTSTQHRAILLIQYEYLRFCSQKVRKLSEVLKTT